MCKGFLTRWLRWAIKATDAVLRHIGGVTEFEADANGLLRIRLKQATRVLTLSDGVRIAHRAPILDLHFWNEHLPPFPSVHDHFDWLSHVEQQLQASLHHLALYIHECHQFGDVQALCVRLSIPKRGPAPVFGRLLIQAGFELVETPVFRISRLLAFLEGIWMWLLTWLYNPRGLIMWRFKRTRQEYWISRARFLAQYDEAYAHAVFSTTHQHRSAATTLNYWALATEVECYVHVTSALRLKVDVYLKQKGLRYG